ncbi:MAG TPA: hypothetical protein VHW23_06805 [Kofleriaceae bacterium]|jgi:hypothetical protein|nr:hypothetical protein [Kofleriaceae bacterium]
MRAVVALAGPALLLALWAGCQSSKSAPPPPASAPAPAAPAATLLPPAGGAAPSAEPAHVKLPRSPDTPVHPTRTPLDAAVLGRLAATEFADFDREDQGAAAGTVRFRHTTRSRPHLAVSVTMSPCGPQHACPAMDLASWNARRDELRGHLPKTLRDRPDTRFEIGAHDIAGAPAIYTYQLGYAGGSDEHDQPSADYTDSYVLYYNDKINQIQVMAHYVDDATGGIPQLLAIAPPEDLETLAVAFASYYVRAWP